MKSDTQQKLLLAGAILFLLGLLSGFVVPFVKNPRMGLSSHLEGVMNGMFLLLVGLLWGRLVLSCVVKKITIWLVLYATYGNFFFVQTGAIFGTNSITPIASAGHQGLPWQETIVSVGLTSVAAAIVAAVGILIWGLLFKIKVE